jgi:hypothetical protein
MNAECGKCGRGIMSRDERDQGLCAPCIVGSWSPEKRAAMDRLIGIAMRRDGGSVIAAIDEALKHMGKPCPSPTTSLLSTTVR